MATSNAWACISFSRYLGGLNECPLLKLRGGCWGWLLFIYTDAARTNMEVSPTRVYVRLKLFKAGFVVSQNTVTDNLGTAFLLVSDTINDLINILLTMLSNMGIWGLGVKGLLTPDETAEEIGVVGVGGGWVRGARRGWGNLRLIRGARGARRSGSWIHGAGVDSCYALYRGHISLI